MIKKKLHGSLFQWKVLSWKNLEKILSKEIWNLINIFQYFRRVLFL